MCMLLSTISYHVLTLEAALNWPLHRGTATAFPLSAFGLSAFFFTTASSFLFPGETSEYLLLLSIGTFALTFVSFFFVYIPHPEAYHALATSEDRPAPARRDSNQLSNSQTWRNNLKTSRSAQGELGKLSFSSEHRCSPILWKPAANTSTATTEEAQAVEPVETRDDGVADEASSLLSAADSDGPGDVVSEDGDDKHASIHHHHSHRADISGFKLLGTPEFYSLWVMLGILTGIGLMTINNIGNDVSFHLLFV
jgi:hypothetical protein